MPSKLFIAAATFGATRLRVEETWRLWITGSALSLWRFGTLGFSFASCSLFESAALIGGIERTGGETSL